jgi:HAD superfamily hydrolase (TIGR01450 family)
VAWALDLDGVVWRGTVEVPGSAAAVAALREAGQRVVFLTNNSALRVGEYVEKLRGFGIPASADDVLTSAQAAARLLAPGSTALVCAGPGVNEALAERGVEVVREGPADAVVVGWHRSFDYEGLTAAASAVMAGARLIGTNDDATYPTPTGELPGGGALLAAVAYAASVVPEVAGKPHEPMVQLVAERVGPVEVMVGDRPSTDGLMARRLGARFALVLSGVTPVAGEAITPVPDEVAPDLAGLVARYQLG